MTVRFEWLPALLLALPVVASGQDRAPVILSGEVRADNAEVVYVPPSDNSPVVLRYLVPEGAQVQAGDVLVRIDPGQALTQIDTLRNQIDQAAAKADKELAELRVAALDAALALVDAQADLDKAKIDAAIPKDYLPGIDYDRYQAELERATREFALKTRQQQAAQAAVAQRIEDARIERLRLDTELEFAEARVAAAEQRATRAGVVLFGFHPWTGQRFEEGVSAGSGMAIGQVIGDSRLMVRAWALAPDRAALALEQPVRLRFDALPDTALDGRITAIGGAPEPKAEWGNSRYFSIDIALPDGHGLPLLPGMSARIEPVGDDA